MSQPTLPFASESKPAVKPRSKLTFGARNEEAARIILDDPGRYGADGALAEWARRVLGKERA